MVRAHFTRIVIIVGWVAGSFILPVLDSEPAQACVIFTKYSVVVSAIAEECTVGPDDEDNVGNRNQKILSDDELDASNPSGFVLWSPSENRSQVLAVHNVAGRHSPVDSLQRRC